MYHSKVVILFIVWCYANTAKGSPISLERKCNSSCETTTKNWPQIEDQRENGTVNYSNIVQGNSNGPVLIEPVALKREKRLVDTANTTLLEIGVADSVNVTTQSSARKSAELSVQPKTSAKDESDFTNSIEYKKAQENLLSASQKVSEAESSTQNKSSLNTENLSDNNQASNDTLDLEDILKQNYSSEFTAEGEVETLQTDISEGSTNTEFDAPNTTSIVSSDSVESDSVNKFKVPVISVESTAKNLEIDDTTIVRTAPSRDDDIGNEGDTLMTAFESSYALKSGQGLSEPTINAPDEAPIESVDKAEERTSIANADKPEISAEEAKIKLNASAKTNGHHGLGETITAAIANNEVPEIFKESSEPKSNAADEMKHISGDEATFVNAANTSKANSSENVDTEIEPVVNVPTNLKPTNPDSIKDHQASKLYPETVSEAFGMSIKNPDETTDTTSALKVNTPVVTIALDKAETHDVSEKHNETLTIPNTPTEPINLPDTTTDTPKEIFHKSGETDADDQIYFIDIHVDRHDNDMHNVDDLDTVEQYPFEEFMGEPCGDCENIGEREDNILNSLSSESDEEYEHPTTDDIEYSPHAYDTSRHFEFFDDFESDNEMEEELFDSDIEFNYKKRENFAHDHTPCDDDDEE